jgi:hypothetical protein
MCGSSQVSAVAVLEHLGLTLILSLSDPTLPPYYVMNYCILIASALDDWNEAEIWIFSALHVWNRAHAEGVSTNDNDSLAALDEIWGRLGTLEEQRLEDLTGMTKEEGDVMDTVLGEDMDVDLAEQELSEDVDGFDLQNQDEWQQGENADEVGANQITLRPLRDHATQTSNHAIQTSDIA